MYMVWIWLVIGVAAMVVELCTPQFVSLWFAVSAAICLGLSFIPGLPWWAQIIIFVGLSMALLFALRPLCNKYLLRKQVATNSDRVL